MSKMTTLNGLEVTDAYARENMVVKPTSAKVGQMLIVKSVDENGIPTEWEVKDSYSKGEIDTKLQTYVDEVAELVGGDA